MSEYILPVDEAARTLPQLVDRLNANGKEAVLVKSGRAIARIIPISAGEQDNGELVAFLRRWRVEHPDPDDQFAEVIEESRKTVRPPVDRWES